MGILQKTAKFIGIDKFGKGLATAGRVISGQVGEDTRTQQNVDVGNQKLLYALKKEKDPVKKKQLEQFLYRQQYGNADPKFHNSPDIARDVEANQIDPGLNLSNKEVVGSAANVALNVATPGAFKGGKTAVIGKNAFLGAGFGAASGLEKNRSNKGIVGSTVGGAVVGAGLGAASVVTKVAKDFFTRTTPEWMMNHAVKPALNDLKKNVRYGTDTLGKELLDEGVKGGPQKLLDISEQKLKSLEGELQTVLTNPNLAEAKIARTKIQPYLKELLNKKEGVPGLQADTQRIKQVYQSLPEYMSLPEANALKRKIYDELRHPAYKIDAKLSVKSQALKSIAHGLKQEIEHTVGGTVVKDINRKLSIYGRLEENITDQIARAMRSNAFSLTDMLLLVAGGANAAFNDDQQSRPLGLLAALAAIGLRHNSTALYTGGAKALNKASKVGIGAAPTAVKEITRRGVLNIP
jgi:ribosomal protein L27